MSRRHARQRIIAVVVVTTAIIIIVGAGVGPGQISERARFVFPNGDVFSPSELSKLTGAYYIERFAIDPAQLLRSGDATVKLRVTVCTTCLEVVRRPFTGSKAYRFLHDDYSVEDWEVVIEDYNVTDVRNAAAQER
jgi:hypothetical protein